MAIEQQRLSQLQVATPTAAPAVGSSAATIMNGLAPMVRDLGTALKGRRAAEDDSVEVAMEKDLLDISFSAIDAAQQQDEEEAIADKDLTPSEKRTMAEATGEANRLQRMEEQGGASTNVRVEQVRLYRQYRQDNPKLAGRLSKVFKQQTGNTAVETLNSVVDDLQKSASEEQALLKTRLLSTAKALGFTPTTETVPELVALVGPYEDEMVKSATAARKADTLDNLATIKTEDRRVIEQDLVDQGFAGTLIEQQATINELLQDFNYSATPDEDRKALVGELQVAKRAIETAVRDRFKVVSIDKELAPILAAYDDAIKVATGELDLKVLQNSNTIRRETVMLGLHKRPGFTETVVRLETLRNIPKEYVAGGQAKAVSIGLVQPLLNTLATGMANPDKNPYAILAVEGTTKQIGKQYEALRDTVLADIDNGDAVAGLSDALQSWTNEFSENPDDVPVQSLSAMLDVFSDKRSIALLERPGNLSQNMIGGMRSYNNRLRGKTAELLASELSTTVLLEKETKLTGGTILDWLTFGYTDDMTRTSKDAKLIDLLEINFNRDGSLVFTPRNIPELRGNREVAKKAQSLTRTIGPVVGKLTRSYAHLMNGDTNYQAAINAMVRYPNWSKPIGEVATEGPVGRTPEDAATLKGQIDRGGE